MNISTYLKENNVIINEKLIKNTDINPYKQIELIIKIHEILINQNKTIIPRINSTIGKEVENFKMQIKKVNRILNRFEKEKNIDYIDIYFIDTATSIVKQASSCIECIEDENYYSLIKRSMKNYELCLGRVDESNLILEENGDIAIRTVKYISYNLIEQDILSYIKRIKRRKINIDIDKLIDVFIDKSGLDDKSKQYIKTLEAYPLESMRLLSRYNTLKNEDFIGRLEQAIKIDKIE